MGVHTMRNRWTVSQLLISQLLNRTAPRQSTSRGMGAIFYQPLNLLMAPNTEPRMISEGFETVSDSSYAPPFLDPNSVGDDLEAVPSKRGKGKSKNTGPSPAEECVKSNCPVTKILYPNIKVYDPDCVDNCTINPFGGGK